MFFPGRNCFVSVVLLVFCLSAIPIFGQKAAAGSAQDVLTYHGDNLRTGWFSAESKLTVSNVNPNSFGLLKTVVLDGRVDGEPLYVSQQTILNKGVHNVVYVATENNSVYAIDADSGVLVWRRHYGVPVPYQYKDYDDNVFPVMGILSTPVIDRGLGNLYFVSDIVSGKVDQFRLRAVSLTSGISTLPAAVIKTSARLADGSTWTFNPKFHLQRPGLLEANGAIYVAFGSNGDNNTDQSRGTIVRYDASSLLPLGSGVMDTLAFNTNSYFLSSIWQSGYAPAADGNGGIYFSTGNSDPGTPSYSQSFNRPDSIVHLSADLNSLVDSFTPSNYFSLDQVDNDLGAAGILLLPDQPGATPHLAVGGSKDGRAFLLNRDNLGGYTEGGPDKVLQTIEQGGCWCGPAYFVDSNGKSNLLTGGGNGVTSWQLVTSPSAHLVQNTSTGPGPANGLPEYGGTIPVVSSNGTMPGTAIVWFVQKPQTSSDSDPGTPVTLMAYDATDLTHQLFSVPAGTWTHAVNSSANIFPTVANGKVYVASNQQLQIFGLTTKAASARAARLALTPSRPQAITCAPLENAASAVQNSGAGTHQFYGTVCGVTEIELQLSLRSRHSIAIDIRHAFATRQRLALTPGRAIHVQATFDEKGVAHAVRISPAHTLSPLTPADR